MLRSFLEGAIPPEFVPPPPYEAVSLFGWRDYSPRVQYQKIVTHFRHGMWRENMAYLEQAYTEYNRVTGQQMPAVELVLNTQEAYAPALKNILFFPRTASLTEQQIARQGVLPPKKIRSDAEARSIVREAIQLPSRKPLVFFSGSHATTHETFAQAVELSGRNDIGLWVLDHHIDTYIGEDDLRLFNTPLAKANVLLKICQLPEFRNVSPVRAVGVTGVLPEEAERFACSRLDEPPFRIADLEVLRGYGHGESFHITPEDSYTDQNGMIDEAGLMYQVDQMFEHFAERGVRSLYISIDPDVLRNQEGPRTGMEYSLYSAHLNMGVQSLREFFHHRYPQNPQSPGELAAVTLGLFEATRELRAPLPSLLKLRKYQPMTAPTRAGMPIHMLHRVLLRGADAAQQHGIQLGIPVGNRVVAGDIVELGGYDYRGYTSDTAFALAERLEQIVQK